MTVDFLSVAAMATAAVPGLTVTASSEWTAGRAGDYDSAIVRDTDGRTLLARVPASPAAVVEQAAQKNALAAMTAGVRARLPFAVPHWLGGATDQALHIGVFDYLPGYSALSVPIEFDSQLVIELGRAIAAIHELPRGFAVEAGLPQHSAEQARETVEDIVDRADATGRLPRALADRWGAAVDDARLWDYAPTVTHGSLERESFLTNGVGVTGVLGWSDLQLGDPAADLRWVQTLDAASRRRLFDEYTEARGASVDRQVRQRALLYAELELARWLLLGTASADEAVIADAEQLLDSLVTRVRGLEDREIRHETLPVLDVVEVRELLEEAGAKTRHPTAPSVLDRGATFRTGPVAPVEVTEEDVDDLSDDTPDDERERAGDPRRDA